MTAAQLASIAITPGFVAARPGDNVTLTVTGRNATGGTTPTGALTFTSRTTGVATVNSSGQVTAVAAGTAVIVAQATANPAIADSILVAVAGNGTARASGDGQAAVRIQQWPNHRRVTGAVVVHSHQRLDG